MPTIDRPPIVIDTNVLISAGLLPRSRTAEALAVAVEHFVIAQNEATWGELEPASRDRSSTATSVKTGACGT